jgi:uncharacterized membrane protein
VASTVENSIEIDRPTAAVFAFVDDYRNSTRYVVGMTEYKPTTKQTSGRGSKFKFVKKTTGLPDIKSEIEITDWQKDKKITFKSFAGFENGGTYTFAGEGDTSVVRLSNTYDLSSLIGGNRGGLFGGLAKAAGGIASKAAEGQVRKDLTTSLEKLRSLVEQEVKPRPATKAAGSEPSARKAVAQQPAAPKAAAKAATKAVARAAASKKPTTKKPTTKKPTTKKSPAGR